MSKKEKTPKQRPDAIVKNIAALLGKIAKYTPEYIVFTVLRTAVSAVSMSASTIFTYFLLNSLDENAEFGYVAKIIMLMAAVEILQYLFYSWNGNIRFPLSRQKLHLRMHEELFKKSLSLDISCFDDPEFYNDFVWAMDQSDGQAAELLENLTSIVGRFAAATTVFGLLLHIDPVVAVIILASSLASVICNLASNKLNYKHSRETNPLWRKKAYINRVYHLSDYAKELRVSHAHELIMKDYDEKTEKLIETNVRYGKKYFFINGLGWDLLSNITTFSILIYMILMLDKGYVQLGGFAASINAIWQIRWNILRIIEDFGKLAKQSLYIEKYLSFLKYEPTIKSGTKALPEFESLELRDVSFSYDFSAHPKYKFHDKDYVPPEKKACTDALKHISLTLRAGEKIAIVGYNGAGKTTLTKLIMRLYDPDEGEILYNGVNIKEFDVREYRKKIGAVFQDFKIFATTVAENVMNGSYDESDRDTVLSALKSADFTEKLSTLEDGIETQLTREFDENGTNLSGGESQKIAISRVFAKDYPIVIMDEPSSALDPTAEYNLNKSILHSTEGKTVIFISHRLSTTRIADRILMFDSGELIEEGSHDELISKNGKYAEMFNLQSQKYHI